MSTTSPKTLYFAGELFSLKHLLGNAALAHRIQTQSKGRYTCILPQSLEQRGTTCLDIRNQDIAQLLRADLCLCNFDGTEIDAGTVVEFMIAKFLDIPTVLLRTDFRKGGDHESGHWNLMLSGYPRTKTLTYDAMAQMQAVDLLSATESDLSFAARTARNAEACLSALDSIATDICGAFDSLCDTAPILPPVMRSTIYEWARQFPGGAFDTWISVAEKDHLLSQKIQKGLL